MLTVCICVVRDLPICLSDFIAFSAVTVLFAINQSINQKVIYKAV